LLNKSKHKIFNLLKKEAKHMLCPINGAKSLIINNLWKF
jgi:hypothetical protein